MDVVLRLCIVFIVAEQIICLPQNKYHISTYTSNWFEAVEYCHRLGMRLAVVDSSEKHDAIVKAASATGLQSTGFFGLWLGASDLARSKSFVWHDTGDRVTFAKWKEGEPNGQNERCVNLYHWPLQGFEWTWNNAPCDTSLYAICENRIQCAVEQF
ncbi:C-type lectin mannose-binding isoform-like [Malaya genurostris]|uniref:C-type lectin mannose-binding isoform-like n=1 Tax=Malaya genurostris TaxID=325434 RepID=UPI0026F40168|nr:C-type lectin mannose-binding isoform-like [Malaya genurostris]